MTPAFDADLRGADRAAIVLAVSRHGRLRYGHLSPNRLVCAVSLQVIKHIATASQADYVCNE